MTNWSQIYELAKNAGAKFPEVVAAQWALESGFGKHLSGKNNYFGIKGKPGTARPTKEWVNGKFVTVTDYFKDFSSPEECVQYLVDRWFNDYKNYKGVNRADSAAEAARLLVIEGYATDPNYTTKLVKLMGEFHDEQARSPEDPDFLERAAFYHERKPHQKAAWRALQQALDPETLETFKRDYRDGPMDPSAAISFPLPVPYAYQRDSDTGHGERMCFSSAMFMAIEYLDPDALSGDADDYLRLVLRYGDTVDSSAQLKAARSLGLDVDFRTNCTEQDLLDQLDRGIPVPIGILHKGPISSPSGGGHWITLIGYTDTHFIVHDPFGLLDLVNGGYPKRGPTDGKGVYYSRRNLMRRWLINGPSDGWAMMF